MKIIFSIFIFLHSASIFGFVTRGELERYTLMHDRVLVLKSLKNDHLAHFINIDLYVSSRFQDFVISLSENAGKGATGTLEALSKDINTEYFLDLSFVASVPLPDLRMFKLLFLPNIFVDINLGMSLSDSNKKSSTNPEIYLYVREQIKFGIHFLHPLTSLKNTSLNFSIYQMRRSDSLAELDTAAIESSGKLINSNDLATFHIYYAADFSVMKYSRWEQHLIELKEIQIYSKSKNKTKYGTIPFFHYRYEKYWKSVSNLSTLLGVHARIRYNITNGLYVGLKFENENKLPFKAALVINNQFINLNPAINFKYFFFSYSLLLPYSNPQDNLWVGSIHNINISVPLP